MPMASPAVTSRLTFLSTWTDDGPSPRVSETSFSSIMAFVTVDRSYMWHEEPEQFSSYGLRLMAFKHHLGLVLAALLAIFATVSASLAQPYKIVGFGDSLMAGYGLRPGEAFPEKLEAALRKKGHDVVIANAGVSGDTTSGGLSRLDWSVPDGAQLVILELGANDMLRGLAPDVTEKNLDGMLKPPEGTRHRRAVGGHAVGAQSRSGLCPGLQWYVSAPCKKTWRAALSVFPRRRRR